MLRSSRMRFNTNELYKRVTNFTLALILGVSTLTASVPFIFTQHASAVGASEVVYDALPSVVPATNHVSLGYQATSTSQFGDLIRLGGTNRVLDDVTVTLSSWAKWSDYSSNPLYSGNSSTFSHPITLNVYSSSLGANGAPNTLLATKTQNFDIPYRPEVFAFNGIAHNITFDMSSLGVALPNDIIVGVAYNTQSYGASPLTVAGPYNSLNVAIPQNQVVSVGSDDSTDRVFFSSTHAPFYTDGGSAGVGIFREDSDWSPYGTVAFEITATAIEAPVNGHPHNEYRTTGSGWDYTWDAVAGASTYEYQASRNPSQVSGVLNAVEWNNIANGDSTQNNLTSPIIPSVGTADGTWYWQVRAIDEYGVKSSWSSIWNVIVDTQAPTKPTNFNPSNGSIQSSALTFDWLASTDTNPLTYELQYSTSPSQVAGVLNGTVTTVSNIVATEQAVTGLSDGYIFWQVRAKDSAGNYSLWSDIWGYQIDGTYPVINFTGTTPTADAYIKGVVGIQAVITDTNIGPYNLRIEDGAPAPLSLGLFYVFAPTSGATNTYSWDTKSGAKAVSDGVHKLVATTTDKAGNKSTITRNVTVDNTKPVVTIVNPLVASINPSVIQIDATDNIGLKTVTANIYNASNTVLIDPCSATASPTATTSYTLNCAISGLADGVYTIRMNAADMAGNIASTLTRQFTIDNTAPVVTINPITTTTDNTPTITGTVDDSDATVTVTVDGIDYIAANTAGVWAVTLATIADGTYTVQVTAEDTAGNVTSPAEEASLLVDTTAPVVVIVSQTTAGNQPTISGTVNDLAATLSVTFNGDTYTVTNNVGSWSFTAPTALANGTYVFSITATDTEGNFFTQNANVVVAVVTPEAATLATPAGTVATTTTPTTDTTGVLGETDDNTDVIAQNQTSTDEGKADVAGETDEKTNKDSSSIFGIAWYWWLLILAALGVAGWWIIGAIRKRNADNS